MPSPRRVSGKSPPAGDRTNDTVHPEERAAPPTDEPSTTVNDELQVRNSELSQSTTDLTNLINSVGMAMIMLDKVGRIRRFTPMAGGMFSLSASDVGRPIGEARINLEIPSLGDIVADVLATGDSRQYDLLDSQGYWKQLRASAYRADDGAVDGVVLLLADIHELKRDELHLLINEARLRIIHDQAPVGIYELDARGNFRRVNSRLCAITGYAAEALTGKRFSEITHADDLPQIEEGFARLQSGAVATFRAEKRYVRPDGEIVWVDVHRFGVRDVDGSTFVVGLVEDITERVVAEELQAQREARFRELADGTPVLMWAAGPGGFEFVNQAYLRFVGSEERLLGDGWTDYLHPDDRAGVVAAYEHAVAAHAPFERQFRYRAADGGYRWMMSVAVPRFGARGDVIGHLGSTFDIGDFKEAEASLIEADHAKNAFIAMLAHELRNPIAVLVNTAEIMSSPSVSEERMQWARAVLRRQLKHLSRMVDDLLDISRVTQGLIRLQPSTVPLHSVLQTSVDVFLAGHASPDVALTIDIPETPILILGDPMRLEQIFVNLLHNAYKFTPVGGHVHLSVAMPQNGRTPVVEVIVRDDGEGIEEAMLQRIFEPFVQVDTSGGRAHQGLGIGLSLVKSLAELHGGNVRATSLGRNKGSAFIVTLPLPPSGV